MEIARIVHGIGFAPNCLDVRTRRFMPSVAATAVEAILRQRFLGTTREAATQLGI
jgi:hypothetical protein